MAKYVEITDELYQLLKAKGVSDRLFFIVQDRNAPILRAIKQAIKIDTNKIFAKSSEFETVMARVFYIHFARMNGDTIKHLSETLKYDKRAIRYYISLYEERICYIKEYKKANAQIIELLEADSNWKPLKVVPIKPRARARNKKKTTTK